MANQMAELRQAKQDLEQEVDTQKKRLRLHIEAQVRAAVILEYPAVILECPEGAISGQREWFDSKPLNILSNACRFMRFGLAVVLANLAHFGLGKNTTLSSLY